jgi:CDP-diacylglycerol--glycerol-3-phosphate 3-phosphatidyltransferase
MPLRHLPNLITASRGLAGIAVAWLLVVAHANVAAFAIFIAAMLTDLVDGWLARRLDARSEMGELLDPLADKMLTGVTWLALLSMNWAPWWLGGPILARDLVVAIVWRVSRAKGVRWDPNLLGRLMVSYEGVALPLLLLHDLWAGVHWASVGVVLGAVTLVLSLGSAAQYLWKGPRSVG